MAAKKNAAAMPADGDAKKKALQTAISQIERDFGAGAVMRLGENAHMEVQAVHTGSISLDMALGIGGLPKGRIVEIYGEKDDSPEKRVRDKDKKRAAYYGHFTEMTWGDPAHYDLCLNSGKLGIDKCVEIISTL